MRPGSASDAAFEPVPRAAAAVLVGDFNFKPDDPDHARLLAPMDTATPGYFDA
jgi:endonuclease/exonuclease/phosphatase family metal-dependent hydrolase